MYFKGELGQIQLGPEEVRMMTPNLAILTLLRQRPRRQGEQEKELALVFGREKLVTVYCILAMGLFIIFLRVVKRDSHSCIPLVDLVKHLLYASCYVTC